MSPGQYIRSSCPVLHDHLLVVIPLFDLVDWDDCVNEQTRVLSKVI